MDWQEFRKSVATNIATAILSAIPVGVVCAYIWFRLTFDEHERRITNLETRPFVTSPGIVPGEGVAEAPVIVPKGETAVLLISANAHGTAEGKQFRSEINVRIEVNGNVSAREMIWVPQYAYDPVHVARDKGLSEAQAKNEFPRVASPVPRLERIETLELATSASAIVQLKEGAHTIRAICDGNDITSRHVLLTYVVIRNSEEPRMHERK